MNLIDVAKEPATAEQCLALVEKRRWLPPTHCKQMTS
jgi:hypothetical protein